MSSSDDDIMGLLPTRGRGRGNAAPNRLRNFKAMMSDTSSDEEDKKSKSQKKKPLPDIASVGKPPSSTTPTPKSPAVVVAVETPSKLVMDASPIARRETLMPTPNSLAAATTAASETKHPDGDSDNESSSSIQFLQEEGGDKTDEVSMDLQSTMDDVTPPRAVDVAPSVSVKEAAPQPGVAKTTATSNPLPAVGATRNAEQRRTADKPEAPVSAADKKQANKAASKPIEMTEQPVVKASEVNVPSKKPASTISAGVVDGQDAKAPPVTVPVELFNTSTDHDEENELLREVLPLHPTTASRSRAREVSQSLPAAPPVSQRTRSPSANSVLMNGVANQPPSPTRRDPLEELLVRAQQRLKEKERLDQSLTAANIPLSSTVTVRAPSPMRPTTRSASATVGDLALPVLPLPDSSREARLQKENQRLAEELAFLSRENQKLRTNDSQSMNSEVSKLQVHVEVLKQQLREVELESQRGKSYLESQLDDAVKHTQQLEDEIRSQSATTQQIDAMSREKDARIVELQQQIAKLQSSLQEKNQEVRRIEEDAKRQREDDKGKLDRANGLFEDVKKQRSQLQELNDKFQKDKEAAVQDRRRLAEEMRVLQQELARERDRHTDEVAALGRDLERYRQLLQDKERTLNAQLNEERRAKEHFQSRLAELEDQVGNETQSLQAALRSSQEEYRRAVEENNKKAQFLADRVQNLTAELESAQGDYALKMQREKGLMAKEMGEKVQVWKEQRDAAEERRRVAEDQVTQLTSERDQYRREYERCCEINAQWQKSKDKAEIQNVQLQTSLQQLIAQDEQLMQDNERYRNELEQAYQDIATMRAEMDQFYQLEQQLQDLSAENDRISDECSRVTVERNELIQENAKLADEMVKWRNDMKDLFASQKRGTSSTTSLSMTNNGGTLRSERSISQRIGRVSEFTF